MIARVAAVVAGVVTAPAVMAALFRLLDLDSGVPVLVVAGVVAGLCFLKGGLLRWFGAGLVVGVIGFEVVVIWALDKFQ